MGSSRLMIAGVLIMLLSLFIAVTPFIPQMSHSTQEKSSYTLSLFIAPRSQGNYSDYSFFASVDGVSISSSAINVPSNTTVKISVKNLDPGTDPLLKQSDMNLTGAALPYLAVSSLNATSSEGSAGSYVSGFSQKGISHTFTTSTGLNIPIAPLSQETVYAVFSTPGNYSWGCMCQCGPTSMQSQGWMYGLFVVS